MPRRRACHRQADGGRMQLVSSLHLLLLGLLTQVCVCSPGANLTSNVDRIKIIFTPMRCRRVCSGGRCYNSCEKGDITTVYSETSHQQQQQPKNQGFRLCECWFWNLNIFSLFFLFYFLVHLSCLCLNLTHFPLRVSILHFHSSFFFIG